ncbi:MAG TPA: hypothetical protein VFQ14_00895 [Thermoleophilaceae bacterium]|nr:hypothetical protein [Thermoleophilaceae bacterium]
MARNDPTESGGLFVRRPSEVRGVKYRGKPQRGGEARKNADRGIAYALLALETLLCLSLFGPQPYFWFWFGSQVQYWTDSVSAGIATIMAGTLFSLLVTVALAKRVDNGWKLVRRAAGYKQERGALEVIFAISVGIAVVIFAFWFFIIEGPGPSVAPR